MKKLLKKISFAVVMVLILGSVLSTGGMCNVYAAPTAIPANPAKGIFAPYTDRVPSDGLVAYYQFEENLLDSSFKGNNGTAVNGQIKYMNGALGSSAVFDGQSYIEVASSDSLNLYKDFTISVWLYKDGWGEKEYAPVLTRGDSSTKSENTPYALLHGYQGYKPCLELVNSKSYDTLKCETEVSKQKWHLVTVTFNGTEAKFYIDGAFKNKASWGYGELSGSDQKLLIGCYPFNETLLYKGAMDELRLYNRLLTDAEIKCLYDDVMATKDNRGKLVAHYRFDLDIKDYSGFNNNGSVAAGEIKYEKGIFGYGAKFDGTTYLEVPDSDSLDVSKAFTISAWLYKDNAGVNGYAPIVVKGSDDMPSEKTPFAFYHNKSGTNMDLRMDNTKSYNTLECMAEAPMKKWHYVTVTFDGAEVKFYIDGVFKSKSTWEYGELFHSNQKLLIGYYPYGSEFFTGIMDDLRIYNYALTGEQIKLNYDTLKIANDFWKTCRVQVSVPVTERKIQLTLGTAPDFDVFYVDSKGNKIKANEYTEINVQYPSVAKYEAGKLIPLAPGETSLYVQTSDAHTHETFYVIVK